MSDVPDTTETEIWIIDSTRQERCGRKIGIQFADSEIRLNPSDRETPSRPTCTGR